jgi:thiamine biosynthesis lipoprotein
VPSPKSNSKPKPDQSPGLPEPQRAWSFEAIGTTWWLAIYERPSHLDLNLLYKTVQRRIEKFDTMYSRFRPDSLVSLWSHKAGIYDLPADAAPMIELYRHLYKLTAGAVTPLIGQVLADAGYDATYSLQPKHRLASPPPWDDVLEFDPSESRLHIKQPVLLDFGAAGKGYLVDIVSGILEDNGITKYCVDAGGDIRYRHTGQPLVVGLEHPDDTSLAVGVAEIGGPDFESRLGRAGRARPWAAICGSATNRRTWSDYHHIIDPAKLESPTHIKAVWVTAESAMVADGLTTALYFVGPEKLIPDFSFAYSIIHTNGSLAVSGDFPAQFFTA